MSKRKKQFRAAAVSQGSQIKVPAKLTEPSTDHVSPHFWLRHLGTTHPLSACDSAEQAALARRLFELGQLTWSQIKAAPRHGQGFEQIARNALRGVTLPPEATEDVSILSFRFAGMKPMLGFRTGRLLTLIALDRDFTAYNHG